MEWYTKGKVCSKTRKLTVNDLGVSLKMILIRTAGFSKEH